MSLLSLLGPTSQPPGKSGGAARTEAPGQSGKKSADLPPAPAPAPVTSGGAAAPAEATQTAARVPPPTPARAANAGASARPGGDGGDATVRAEEALADAERFDAARSSDMDEARRYAEAAKDRLIAQEILSRIPVPVEALPRLTVEAKRVVDESTANSERPAHVA